MRYPQRCRAAVTRAAGDCSVEWLAVPAELQGGALVEVEAAAVCGTDWSHYHDEGLLARGPLVLGHENVGRVAAIGEEAQQRWGVGPGDRVVVEELIPCGACAACRSGRAHRCPRTDYRVPGALRYGRTPIVTEPGLWGGFAELLYVHPRGWVHPVPAGLEAEVAAFANPVANGLRWLGEVAQLRRDERVLVIGPGAHGLGCVLAARALTAGRVVTAGLSGDERRLADAQLLGASASVRLDAPGAAERVRDALEGDADVVVDLAPGATSTVGLGVAVAAPGGRLVLAGHKSGREVPIDADVVLAKELQLSGVRGPNRRSMARAVELLAQHADRVRRLDTQVFGLDEVDAALRTVGGAAERRASHVIVAPAASAWFGSDPASAGGGHEEVDRERQA